MHVTQRRFPRATHLRRAAKVGLSAGMVLVGVVAVLASTSAWRPAPPLENALGSPELVGDAVLAALHAGDIAALETLALTEEEFKAYVWPSLPASRPERHVPFDFAWGMLRQNSDAHLRETLESLRGRRLALKQVEFGGPSTSYGEVTVHRRTQLVVETADGEERTIRAWGSTLEHDGQWKVFSYVVD